MQNIHFINKRIGGVGVICDQLSSNGDRVLDLRLSTILYEITYDSNSKIYFHQPRSHLYCLLISLFYPRVRNFFSCVLHEASDYNIHVAKYCRGLVGYYMRRAVVFFLELLNVEILGVSDYVLHSYGIVDGAKISYLSLFKDDISKLIGDQKNNASLLCDSTLTIWIRKGDSHRVLEIIRLMFSKKLFNNINLFGDDSEVSLLKRQIEYKFNGININSHPSRITRVEFIRELNKSTWFLSVFDKEGFGLSIFEAMAAGCICLTSKSGAASEWLPPENYTLLDCIMRSRDFDHSHINKISNLNKQKARILIS